MAELKPGDEAYEIPDNPVYDPVIRKLKRSDPAEADSIFNPLFLQTICNTHAVRALAQEAKDAADAVQEAITELTHTIDTVPSQRGALTYSGSEQTPSWNGYASNALTAGGTTKATNAGTYSAVFTPKTGYKWSDGTADAKTVVWTIGKAFVSVPAQSGSLTYTGVSQSPVWTNYDANKLTLGGAASGTNAGSYNATFTPTSNYKFSDGSTSAKTVAWTIGKASVSIPVQSGGLVYTGSSQSPIWTNYDANKLTLGGAASGTNAGSYNATFTPKANYRFSDGSTSAKTVAWTINRASASLPAQSGNLVYTGGSQTPVWSDYDANKMTLGGTTSGTNAGRYNATFTPTANYKFFDGTISAKTVAWTINKAAGSLSISPTSMTFTATGNKIITVTRAGDGAISAISSNTSVAAVSVSGNTVTVIDKSDGSATITVRVGSGTNHNAPANKTCAVTVSIPKIYGASWDGTSTTKWTRTDAAAGFTDPVPYVQGASNYGSPFDNLQPWAGMVKSERTGGTMVAIPKFWYRLTQNGAGMIIQIADRATAGFSVSPAHVDRSDGKGERSVVYIGRYHCGEAAYKSATGQKPKASITCETARAEIHKLGANIWQADFVLRFTLWLLYIVEFADWNSQTRIGYGGGNGKAAGNMGYTDSMPYHTGTSLSWRTAYGLGTQYRYIEGLWDNVYDWCDGCYYDNGGLCIILNPSRFSNYGSGTRLGIPSSGSPSAFSVKTAFGLPAVFIPTETKGSTSTYSCDRWICNLAQQCLSVGGVWDDNDYTGLFSVTSAYPSSAFSTIGCRLQELP